MADEAIAEEARHAMLSPTCLSTASAQPWESPFRHHAQALARSAIDHFATASDRTATALQDLAGAVQRTPAFMAPHHHDWYDDPLQWAHAGEQLVSPELRSLLIDLFGSCRRGPALSRGDFPARPRRTDLSRKVA
jgi:hypothetical protein